MSGLYQALQTSVAGLRAKSQSMAAISNNIANVRTVGFKRTEIDFTTLVTQATTQTSFTPGGVATRPLMTVDIQGPSQGTTSPTDLSVAGNGMFCVRRTPESNLQNPVYFSRAGSFRPDEAGFLKNTAGYFLQGWPVDQNGNITGNNIGDLQTIQVANLTSPARQTSTITFAGNLPAEDPTVAAPTHVERIKVYDSLGVAHNVEFTFQRIATAPGATGTWQVSITNMNLVNDSTTNSLSAGAIVVNPATINFDASGLPLNNPDITLNFAGATLSTGGVIGNGAGVNGSIAVDFGSQSQADGLTMNANKFFASKKENNGIPHGTMSGVNIDESGNVVVSFDNGFKRTLYKLPLATFNNPNGLEEITGNAYQETSDSGTALLQSPLVGSAGKISASSLEGSNVDIAKEFTDMIVVQSAYTADTRAITTTNTMLDELLRIRV